ncbi:MAG TPA: hypothetical protein VGH19_11865 [Verrucomicrobiae bacterium]
MSALASIRAKDMVAHIFGHTLGEIRKERSHLGLPAEFEFLCLIKGHSASSKTTDQIRLGFIAGQSITSLKELLPAPGHKRPHAGKTIALVQHQEPLQQIFEALFTRGEHDTTWSGYHRPDATLLDIYNVHCQR